MSREVVQTIVPEQAGSIGAGSRCLLAVLSGVLLFLPCIDSIWYAVGWVGFIPVLVAIRGRSLKEAYFLGAIAGTVFWAGVSYWLADFATNLKSYQPPFNTLVAAGFWVYAGQSFGVAMSLYQWFSDRFSAGRIFIFPIVFVTVFSLYPSMFHMRLGEGQTGFLLALQTADITGVIGLDFVMILANMLLFAWIVRGSLERVSAWVGVLILLAWFGYGYYSLLAWDRAIMEWPNKRIGIVQPNDPPSIPIPRPAAGYSRAMPPEMEMTERLARRGAELVVWPEARFKGYFDQAGVRDAYAYHASAQDVAVLFHDLETRSVEGRTLQYNAAALLNQTGDLQGTYHKIKRFAFGEYMPLISEIPFLRQWVEHYFGEFLQEIAPGEAHRTFDVGGMRIVPKICYESAFPTFLADSIAADSAGKVIVLLSQDAWFGRSRQPFQHLWQSAVRAVENRVPVVHAINNGPSGIILPSGRYVLRTEPFARSESVADMPYSPTRGGSFYSRHPRLFIGSVYAILVVLVILRLFPASCRLRAALSGG